MKNFPKGLVRERTELAHSWRQARGASVPAEGRWAPLPCHQCPAGLPPEGAVAAHSGVMPISMAQLPAAFHNRPWEPPGVFPTPAPRTHLLSERVKG